MTSCPSIPQEQFGGRSGEAGSAYVISLLVLLVLTMIGLSLTAVASTERQISTSERSMQRVFYAADWGMDASSAKALATADYRASIYTIAIDDSVNDGVLNFRHSVDVSPFFPILAAACNLCQINGAGQYGQKSYYQVTHAVSSVSTRLAAVDTEAGAKTLASMLDVQPWQLPTESLFALESPAQMAKIKF